MSFCIQLLSHVVDGQQSYMFALFVILVLSLVLAVLLGDVDNATCQVGQQVLDQKRRLTRLPSNTNIEICGPVSWERTMTINSVSSVLCAPLNFSDNYHFKLSQLTQVADQFRGYYLLKPRVIWSNKETIEHSSHLKREAKTLSQCCPD